MAFNFSNFSQMNVTQGYGTGDTSIAVDNVVGVPSTPFRAVWYNKAFRNPADDPQKEVIEVTAASNSPITVVRGSEGSAQPHSSAGAAYAIFPTITADFLNACVYEESSVITFGNGNKLTWGTGTPESNVVGIVGDLYIATDGAAGTTFFVKESGTGNTGWDGK